MIYLLLRGFCWVALRILFRLFGGYRIEGRGNVPRTGGLLIAANHVSDADPLALGAALPRFCYFMGKEELFQIRLIGPLMRIMRSFPIKRYTADRAALERGIELLSRGEALVVFPESRISENAQLQELYPGAIMMASRAGASILPAVLIGTDGVVPYGHLMPRYSRRGVVVRFGRPMTAQELTGGARGGEGYRRGAKRLRDVLQELLESGGSHSPPHETETAPT
jgi:1-acyl-sn-glycerol-3-phosphate acyltransferase